jgi:hypothetical protein
VTAQTTIVRTARTNAHELPVHSVARRANCSRCPIAKWRRALLDTPGGGDAISCPHNGSSVTSRRRRMQVTYLDRVTVLITDAQRRRFTV